MRVFRARMLAIKNSIKRRLMRFPLDADNRRQRLKAGRTSAGGGTISSVTRIDDLGMDSEPCPFCSYNQHLKHMMMERQKWNVERAGSPRVIFKACTLVPFKGPIGP
jgi:hypothetical protein